MNKYDVEGIVGEGAYGVVLKCRNKVRETDPAWSDPRRVRLGFQCKFWPFSLWGTLQRA